MAKDSQHGCLHYVRLSSNMIRRLVQVLFLVFLIVLIQYLATHLDSDCIKARETYRNHQLHTKTGPLHILLVSYQRTGSSFTADILQSLPNSFYYFEPLQSMRRPVLNDSFDEARDLLGNLFICNISRAERFLSWQKDPNNFVKVSALKRCKRYWKECNKYNTCFDAKYQESFCRKQTVLIAKTVRINLLEASKLFTSHPHLNLKIIYLTRDPRGTMNSRMKKSVQLWCNEHAMCFNSSHFCAAINDDVNTVCSLLAEKPEDFMVIRYEDVSVDPYDVTEQLMEFLGFRSVPHQVYEFLESHVNFAENSDRMPNAVGLEYSYTTFRNSSDAAMKWRKEMSFERVTDLQNTCKQFLTAFGYHSYRTPESLRTNDEMNIDLYTALKSRCNIA